MPLTTLARKIMASPEYGNDSRIAIDSTILIAAFNRSASLSSYNYDTDERMDYIQRIVKMNSKDRRCRITFMEDNGTLDSGIIRYRNNFYKYSYNGSVAAGYSLWPVNVLVTTGTYYFSSIGKAW